MTNHIDPLIRRHIMEPPAQKPRVVCLCGSTRFPIAFQDASLAETLAGRIVLSIGAAAKTDAEHFGHMDPDELRSLKDRLDLLHFHKIDAADDILVLSVDGYIGESTAREIQYAKITGKPVRYLHPPEVAPNEIVRHVMEYRDLKGTPVFYYHVEPRPAPEASGFVRIGDAMDAERFAMGAIADSEKTRAAWAKLELHNKYTRSVHSFASVMKNVLRANSFKGHWANWNIDQCYRRLIEEIAELSGAAGSLYSPEEIARECADIANFAMMFAELYADGSRFSPNGNTGDFGSRPEADPVPDPDPK